MYRDIRSKGKRKPLHSLSLTMLGLFLLERLLWPPLSMPSANLNGAVMPAWTLPLFLRGFHFADGSSFGHHKAIVARDFLDFILIKQRRPSHAGPLFQLQLCLYNARTRLICDENKSSCNDYAHPLIVSTRLFPLLQSNVSVLENDNNEKE